MSQVLFVCYTTAMFSAVFNRHYKNLNAKQREAVDTIEGPVMVIAGPGTGKTSILTLRIANILRRTDTPPDAILALSFTEAGVKAMRARLVEIIGARAYEVHLHTFHGFASWVFSRFGEHLPHLSGTRIVTEDEAEKLVAEIVKNKRYRTLRPLGRPDYYLKPILRAITDSKREALSPQEIRAFAEGEAKRLAVLKIRRASEEKQIERCKKTVLFSRVFEAYESAKRTENKIDYDDLILELLRALHTDKLLLQLLQEQFLYLLVDEHQDTNDSQNLVVRFLADFFKTPNLFIVGDEKQAIYRFQGASVENFLRLQKAYPKMKTIRLDENYRSHQKILDVVFPMIGRNYDGDEKKRLHIKLRANNKMAARPVEVFSGETQETTEARLIQELRALLKKGKKETIALIVRTNREVEQLVVFCEVAGIEVAAEQKIDARRHPLGALFLDAVNAVTDPSNTAALARTVAAGLWGLSFGESALLIKEIRSGRFAEVERRIPALRHLRRSRASLSPLAFLHTVAEESGLLSRIIERQESIEVWREICASGEAVLTDPERPLFAKISSSSSEARVSVLTAHSSKGREFDFVFIPYATEEAWMKQRHGAHFVLPFNKEDEDERDARRLFYVALTRARKHIALFVAARDANGGARLPLRFLAELDQKMLSRVSLKKGESLPLLRLKEEKGRPSRFARSRGALARRVLYENGLSVTALNHFCECPSRFFFSSILKLPEPPSASAEKGSAMHAALAAVWRERPASAGAITTVMRKTIRDFLARLFLARAEREAVEKKLSQDAPVIARALLTHFRTSGKVFSEVWSESVFERVPLHGKLDAVIDDGEAARVFDYKTRAALSPAAIRGETKNSDGSYFRQLVFYTLLLERDRRFRGRKIIPSLVFVSPDDKGRCPTASLPVTLQDIENLQADIRALVSAVERGTLLSQSCANSNCPYCRLKDALI